MKGELRRTLEDLREVARIAEWDEQLSVDELRHKAREALRLWRDERDARTPIPQPGQTAGQ